MVGVVVTDVVWLVVWLVVAVVECELVGDVVTEVVGVVTSQFWNPPDAKDSSMLFKSLTVVSQSSES